MPLALFRQILKTELCVTNLLKYIKSAKLNGSKTLFFICKSLLHTPKLNVHSWDK